MKKTILFVLLLSVNLSVFAQDKVKFKAIIENSNGELLIIRDNKNAIVAEIKSTDKKNFKANFVATKGFYMLFDGAEYAKMYLLPGFDLTMNLDAKQFDETIKFKGKGALENNLLAKFTLDEEAFENNINSFSKDQFYQGLKAFSDNNMQNLNNEKLDKTFVEYMKQNSQQTSNGFKMVYENARKAKEIEGKPAPSFDYDNVKGGKTTLESLKGKYVYIDVWATWCGPCRREIPFLKTVEEKFHGKNIEFVSISVDVEKDREKWKTFVIEKQLGGIQLFADKDWSSDFIRTLGINSIPRFILIDPNGNIIKADAPRPSMPELTTIFTELLK